MKKIIINADDFGMNETANKAVLECYKEGIITSASLIVNMEGYNNAITEILPEIKGLDIGLHFNIYEGKSLSKNQILCDNNYNFHNGFIETLIKSKNKEFIKAVEAELKTQLEEALKITKINHIDSHVHIHAIPEINTLMKKTAKEYGIKYVRSQKEIPYIVWDKILNIKFPVNIIKNILLNQLSRINNREKGIKTNNYLIGVLYTGYMDERTITDGIKKIEEEDSITEVILHPYKNSEFNIIKSRTLKEKLMESGFKLTKYSDLTN